MLEDAKQLKLTSTNWNVSNLEFSKYNKEFNDPNDIDNRE